MRIYWYWPFLRREELGLARGVLERGDELLVHTTPRPADPVVSDIPGCTVEAALEAPRDTSEGSARWLASRARTYTRRAAVRDRTVRAGSFDVAHVVYVNRFTDPFTLGRLARRVPLVVSVHDVVPHNTRLPAAFERGLLHLLYRHADTILVHHESLRDRLVTEHGISGQRVCVVPLQIPERVVERPPGSADRAPDGPPCVLFFGTFRRNKGVQVLIDAIERLGPDVDARFVFAGRGAPDVERLVTDAAARDPRIATEIGYATAARKDELHAEAALIVLPYTSFSSQSAVLQDAYTHGLPAVVADVGALGESVREDGTGWVVEPGDAAALATAIRGALADGEARRAAGDAARAVAAARTPFLVGREWRAVYERAIARRRR